MLPEIWSVTDMIYCHFGPFFCPFTPLLTSKIKIWKKCKTMLDISIYTCVPSINEDHMILGSWDIRCNSFISFLAIFFPLTLLPTQKIKISRKWKKSLENGSWDIKRDRIDQFWTTFCPFTKPLKTQKIKIFKNEKMPGDISILHMCNKHYDQMM